MAHAVDAVELDRPRLRLDQPFDRAQRARLARSVRPEQSEDLSPADLEADRVDCRLRPVGDRQVAHLEDPGDPSDGDGCQLGRPRQVPCPGRWGPARAPAAAIRPRAPRRRRTRRACPPLSTCTLSVTAAQRSASASTLLAALEARETVSTRDRLVRPGVGPLPAGVLLHEIGGLLVSRPTTIRL